MVVTAIVKNIATCVKRWVHQGPTQSTQNSSLGAWALDLHHGRRLGAC